MHTQTMRTRILALTIALVCLSTPQVWAPPARPIKEAGTVLSIGHEIRLLILTVERNRRRAVLHWNTDADFIKDGRTAGSSLPKIGTMILIRYRKPVFGGPLFTKDFWNCNSQS